MRPPKIKDRELLRLIDKENCSQTEAAEALGVSRQAVNQRLKEIRGRATKVVVCKKVGQIVDPKIDAMKQLQKINQVTNRLLDELTGEDQLINRMVEAVEASWHMRGMILPHRGKG